MIKSPPVQRINADTNWLMMLISFGIAVIGTRIFLQATGYPQIGGGGLHIAHVLWGGLLQFLALCIFLTFANRWTYTVSAILGGIGIGLFIDEIGKFITQTNDYFFPFAAPIIYASLLLTTVLYLHVRNSRPRQPKAYLYWVLDQLKELVDHDFDQREHENVELALRHALTQPLTYEQHHLIEALLTLVQDVPVIEPPAPNIFERAWATYEKLEERFITRRALVWFLKACFLLSSISGLSAVVLFGLFAIDPGELQAMVQTLVNEEALTSAASVNWILVHSGLTGLTGTLFLIATILLFVGRETAGVQLGRVTLILQLTIVNLLAFYFSQFAMIASTLAAIAIYLGVERYRSRFAAVPPVTDPVVAAVNSV